jgi:hypothetical protein
MPSCAATGIAAGSRVVGRPDRGWEGAVRRRVCCRPRCRAEEHDQVTAPAGPLPVYLGPQLPRWQPVSVNDVRAARRYTWSATPSSTRPTDGQDGVLLVEIPPGPEAPTWPTAAITGVVTRHDTGSPTQLGGGDVAEDPRAPGLVTVTSPAPVTAGVTRRPPTGCWPAGARGRILPGAVQRRPGAASPSVGRAPGRAGPR